MRRFLKPTKVSLLMAVVLAGALVLAGCGGNGNDVPQHVRGDFDVIVVGAGAAGMPAALAAAEELGSTGRVLLLEADSFVGCSFQMAAGGWNAVVGNANQDRLITLDWGVNHSGPGGTLWSAYYPVIDGRFPNGHKLSRIAAFSSYVWSTRFVPERWNVPVTDAGNTRLFRHPVTGEDAGNASGPLGVLSFYQAIGRNDNITLMVNTRATSLRTEGAGADLRVTGVNAVRGGTTYTFDGHKVILATGGMTRNNEMLRDNLDFSIRRTNDAPFLTPGLEAMLEADWFRGQVSLYSTGSGIEMAHDIGAALTQNWHAPHGVTGFDWGFVMALPPTYQPIFRGDGTFMTNVGLRMQEGIVVNSEGRRFASENVNIQYGWGPNIGAGGVGAGGPFSNAMVANGLPPYHLILTGTPAFNTMPAAGVTAGFPITAALTYAANMIGAFRYEVLMDTTLEGLATQMGLTGDAAEAFLATIETYNENVFYAQAGNDYADSEARGGMGKPNATLTTAFIDASNVDPQHVWAGAHTVNGPFFAIRIYPGAISSRGGIMADWRGRVLRANDSVIENLYAVGEMSFRDLFADGNQGGTAIALSITSGFIAGTDAARMVRDRGSIPSLVTDCTDFDADFWPAAE